MIIVPEGQSSDCNHGHHVHLPGIGLLLTESLTTVSTDLRRMGNSTIGSVCRLHICCDLPGYHADCATLHPTAELTALGNGEEVANGSASMPRVNSSLRCPGCSPAWAGSAGTAVGCTPHIGLGLEFTGMAMTIWGQSVREGSLVPGFDWRLDVGVHHRKWADHWALLLCISLRSGRNHLRGDVCDSRNTKPCDHENHRQRRLDLARTGTRIRVSPGNFAAPSCSR